MTIYDAKEQIKNTVTAYLTRDEHGKPVIPVSRQRPLFLMGPPGIGKTAIMEQVAQEMGIGLVSYSMTHHTRQSAIGLPFIVDKVFDGKEYKVSEYTMSEILATVYDMIETTGQKEGILFLDEVNCVSETLAPAMLQFLQYKVFGRHQVPEGWIVAAAGNPPEYNSSVREFDIVTWDRLKRIDIEPDFQVWKEYAYQKGIHPAIMSYLDIRRDHFYKVETTASGKHFVTARGWVDLSEIMRLYELHDLPIDDILTSQYLQDPVIARDFAVYYDLFKKYRADYKIEAILKGKAPAEILKRAQKAPFDERLAIINLLLDSLFNELRAHADTSYTQTYLMDTIKHLRADLTGPAFTAIAAVKSYVFSKKEDLENRLKASAVSSEKANAEEEALLILDHMASDGETGVYEDGKAMLEYLMKTLEKLRKDGKKTASALKKELDNAFAFCENAFGEGQEILVFTTELTVNKVSLKFISEYGCDSYFKHNKDLLLFDRQLELVSEIDSLDISDIL